MSYLPRKLTLFPCGDSAMAMNPVQFQYGMSMPDFYKAFGTERQCAKALAQMRWPNGFHCPMCSGTDHCIVSGRTHLLYQCSACRHQTSLTAGSLFQSTKLPLTIWFLAIYLVSQAKTGLSSLALHRQLGVSYPTAWLLHHKLMHAMAQREQCHQLRGLIQLDDAYLGGERAGGKVGRGSENKVPFVAAVSLSNQGQPLFVKLSLVEGFNSAAIKDWAVKNLAPGCKVLSDGLACFNAVTEANCTHTANVVCTSKPRDLPQFKWVNTVLGNLKTSLAGAYHALDYAKYASAYLAAFCYRFNRRVDLRTLVVKLMADTALCGPHPLRVIRAAEASC